MNILITGDKGFVGKNFRRFYELRGHNVFGVDISAQSPLDARDFFRVDTTRWDLVIHLAAVVGGRLKIEGEPISVAVDLSIDAEMWQWAIRTNQSRVVYFSSSAAYPIKYQTVDSHRKLSESMINIDEISNPDLTYGWSKITGEYIAKFAKSAGVNTFVFRPFSGYGEQQALDYPFPSFVQRAKKKSEPFNIWGPGTQVRDFVHIDDVVACVASAVDQNYQEPLNIGWGRPTSFIDLAEMMAKEVGYTPSIVTEPEKPVGVFWRVADTENMEKVYKPKITLEEGIRRALW